MAPYLLALMIPVGLLYFVDSRQSDRHVALILTSIAIAIPCFLAGARDSGIGMDTLGYGDLIFDIALANRLDWPSFIVAVQQSGFDIGFAFSAMAYIVVGISSSSFWYYFTIEALIIGPCYIAVRLLATGDNRAVSYASLYLIVYMLSLSAMRQFIALSFGFFSVAVLIKFGYSNKGLLISFLLEAVAIAFHKSAAFVVVCHFFWLCAIKYDQGMPVFRKYTFRSLPLVALLVLICASNIDPLFHFVTSSIPLFSRYASYLVTSGTSSGYTFFIFFGMMLAASAIRGRHLLIDRDPIFIVLLCYGALAMVLYALQAYNEEFIRLSYYFWPFIAVAFPVALISGNADRTKRDRNIDRIAFLLFFIFNLGQFAWWYLINDYYGCLPYTSWLLRQLLGF